MKITFKQEGKTFLDIEPGEVFLYASRLLIKLVRPSIAGYGDAVCLKTGEIIGIENSEIVDPIKAEIIYWRA